MKAIAFDIETIPAPWADPFDPESVAVGNLKDPLKIKEKVDSERAKYQESLGLDIYQNMICSFAWCDGADAKGYSLLDGANERDLLLCAWDILSPYEFFVTFNGNQFDVPCLNMHSLFNKIRIPIMIDCKKYRVTNHLDLRAFLTNWETYAKGNLDFWLRRCLNEQKMEGMDGRLVADAWDMGLYEKVGQYNQDDAEKTWRLYRHVSEYMRVQ